MTTLNSNWITDGLFDLEYKKYVLLGYLQSIQKQFNEKKIYPFLKELIRHYDDLMFLKENKEKADCLLPRKVSRIDLEKFRLEYEKMIKNNEQLDIILQLVNYALPRMEAQIDVAREIYEQVENDIDIETVGLIPMNTDAGYLLFRTPIINSTDVFFYELSIIENANEQYRGLKTYFVDSYPNKLYFYNEAIKSDLIRKNNILPNPATYVIQCKMVYPFSETVFPVAKKTVCKIPAKFEITGIKKAPCSGALVSLYFYCQ